MMVKRFARQFYRLEEPRSLTVGAKQATKMISAGLRGVSTPRHLNSHGCDIICRLTGDNVTIIKHDATPICVISQNPSL